MATNHREPAGEEILIVLSRYIGSTLSSKDIASQVNYSQGTVEKWLNILRREGLAEQFKDKRRVAYRLRGKE